jgi:Right handed beta helix region
MFGVSRLLVSRREGTLRQAEPAVGRNEVPLKARMLVLSASLALIVFGGTMSALVLHLNLNLASAHKALPSGAAPSGAAPSGGAPSGAAPSGAAQVPDECITVPHACGFPDATSTGVPTGTALRSVPGQVSSGPGWHFNPEGGYVMVTAPGTVLSGLSISCNLEIDASDVTVQDVQVVTGGNFGISLRHTTGVTIEDSTISGRNLASGRVNSAIDDVYGDSTGMVIKNNDISQFRTAVQVSTGLIAGNYIHDPGYIHGDHTNGIYVAGTTKPLTIYGNTIFNNLGQTDDINLAGSTSRQDVANKMVVDNLLAGGGYSIYGGGAREDRTSNIVIKDNAFGRLYYPEGGQYGPAAYFNPRQAGNVWSGNAWSGTSLSGKVRRGRLLPVTVLPGVLRSGARPGSAAAG